MTDCAVRFHRTGGQEVLQYEAVAMGEPVVGRDTLMASLDCLAPLGMMVSFGNASGPVAQFEPALLAQKGSLFQTGPTLFHYAAGHADLLSMSAELLERVIDGILTVSIGHRHALKECARAHEDLTARRTTGSTLLLPG